MINASISIHEGTELNSRWIKKTISDCTYLEVKIDENLSLYIDESELLRFQKVITKELK